MKIHEVVTTYWDQKEIITSPVSGIIEDVKVTQGEKVNKAQTLLTIRKENQESINIAIDFYGQINRLNVTIGESIVTGDVLAVIDELS